jgi:hypothetical protein
MTSFPFRRRVFLLAAAASVVACHRAPAPALRDPEIEGVIGDTSALGARILQIDRVGHRATFRLAKPAFVLVLAVAPGRSIDPVWFDPDETPSLMTADKHTVPLRMPETVGPAARGGAAQQDQLPAAVQAEIDRCVRQATPRPPRRRPPKIVRDSAGRIIKVEPGEPGRTSSSMDEVEAERNAQRACAAKYGNRAGATTPDTHERYLVVLASNTSMTTIELAARLNALTVTATDSRSTIAAVAQGLFFDRHAVWSGHYVRW